MANPTEIIRRFTYRAPTDVTRPLHEQVNELTLTLAHKLDEMLPEGREKALALTALEDVRFRANQAIATSAALAPAPETARNEPDDSLAGRRHSVLSASSKLHCVDTHITELQVFSIAPTPTDGIRYFHGARTFCKPGEFQIESIVDRHGVELLVPESGGVDAAYFNAEGDADYEDFDFGPADPRSPIAITVRPLGSATHLKFCLVSSDKAPSRS